ncbi:hypothetical protein [Microtetraspora malaysiensis]|uniref:hypothetical protein n=1 Tax=Microtetraspora malaysiensis TaxID=161358 RepID=UPI0008345B6B|nr:hypothetical protein [Microtetraspora malaysiensis]
MDTATERHPLSILLARQGWTAEGFLCRVAARHRDLGYGTIATRREKVSRWIARTAVPGYTTQLAIAALVGVQAEEVRHRAWPDWLLLAIRDDCTVLESPWTPMGTVKALQDVGGPVDRRGFLIASTSALAAIASQWATAAHATATLSAGRRIGEHVADLCDARLDALRHLDDEVGSAQTYDAATVELRLITRLLSDASYTERVGRRLYASAAEAARLAGWCAYDAGHHAAAERHFVAALRAAASAGDHTTGATVLAFWANLRYAAPGCDTAGALGLIDAALADSHRIGSPRVLAMLHVRRARAHSMAREPAAAYRAMDDAFRAYDRSGPVTEDRPGMYWLTAGELHQSTASAALTIGEPRRALQHFDAAIRHHDPYDVDKEARGAVIYLARRAEAHLALGDVDAAVGTAHEVLVRMGGVESARATGTIAELRSRLNAHQQVPAVRDFLEMTV